MTEPRLPTSTTGSPPPDFGWPHRITNLLVEWLEDLWERLRYTTATELPQRHLLRSLLVALICSTVAYLGLLWACFCYLRFPINPYSWLDVAEWVVLASAVVWGTLALYVGAVQLLALLSLIVLIVAYFALSLSYLCFVVWQSLRFGSPWLKRYRTGMFLGTVAIVTVATFVDGSKRFWDEPFSVLHWATLVFLFASAWGSARMLSNAG
jgi:hypothetical protein